MRYCPSRSESFRRLQFDIVTRIDPSEGAVCKQCFQRWVDILPQLLVWTDHPDRDIPVQVRIVFEGGNAADTSVGMGSVEPANCGGRDRRSVDLALGGRVHDLVLPCKRRGFYPSLAGRPR